MNKKLILSILTSTLLLDCMFAETLAPITVTTATKTPRQIDGITASVIVISKEDIEKTSASTISGVLEKIPSINAQFGRFPHPSSASKSAISLRGAGANGTLLLIDGKRLSGETESPYEMNRIPASMIERIEIVKGSMSTLYGSDAIGGVINIITKKVTKNATSLDIKYGANTNNEAKNKNINFNTMGSNESFKYKIYGSITDTSSFREDKNYTQVATNPTTGTALPSDPQHGVNGSSMVTYRDEATVKTIGTRLEKNLNDQVSLGFDINYFNETRDGVYLGAAKYINGGPVLVKNTPVSSNDKNRRLDISSDLDYTINDDLSFNLKLYRSYYKKRNKTNAINFTGPTNTKFSANVEIDTIESNIFYSLNENNLITSGLEYRKETRNSSAINPDPSSTQFITKKVNYKSLYIQDEIDFNETLHATIGARYDEISNADNKVTFQAGIVKNLTEDTNLRFNYSQGYRSPDIAELYVVSPSFKDGKRFGSDVVFGPKTAAYELKPEKSENFEISISNNTDKLSSGLTLFNTTIKDKIDLISYGSGPSKYYTSENLEKVVINGAELSLDYILNDSVDFAFNLTYLDTKNKANNKELMYTPDISASLASSYKINEKFRTNFMIRYIGEQYKDTSNTQRTEDYTLVDLSTSYKINKMIELYGGVDNIFDKEVDQALGTNVGTFIYTGLRVNF